MCVIPIVVRHKNSNKEIKTYAMLENCSQATFAKEHLLGLLGLQGRKTPITIKAMNGEVMKIYKKLQNLEYFKWEFGKHCLLHILKKMHLSIKVTKQLPSRRVNGSILIELQLLRTKKELKK